MVALGDTQMAGQGEGSSSKKDVPIGTVGAKWSLSQTQGQPWSHTRLQQNPQL